MGGSFSLRPGQETTATISGGKFSDWSIQFSAMSDPGRGGNGVCRIGGAGGYVLEVNGSRSGMWSGTNGPGASNTTYTDPCTETTCTCPHAPVRPPPDCTKCLGTGEINCPPCKGTGQVPNTDAYIDGPCTNSLCEGGYIFHPDELPCTSCTDGMVPNPNYQGPAPCSFCWGTGTLSDGDCPLCIGGLLPSNEPEYIPCPTCGGDGLVDGEPTTCETCGGDGIIRMPDPTATKDCDNCGTTGRITCYICNGTGKGEPYPPNNGPCVCKNTTPNSCHCPCCKPEVCVSGSQSASIALRQDSDGGPPTGGCSLAWELGVGRRMPDGYLAGLAYLHIDAINASSYRISQWEYSSFSKYVQRRGSNHGSRWQIKTPDRLIEFVSINDSFGSEKYEIRYYRASDVVPGSGHGNSQTYQDTDEFYSIKSGSLPYVTHVVENPGLIDGSPAFRITEKRGTHSVVREFWCVDEYADAGRVITWHTREGNGERHTVKEHTRGYVGIDSETLKIFDETGNEVSRTETILQTQPVLADTSRRLPVQTSLWFSTAGSGIKRTASITYDNDHYSPGHGRAKTVENSDGSWTRYEYGQAPSGTTQLEETPEPTRIYSPWNGSPATPTAATLTNCRVVKTIYDIDADGKMSDDPIRTEEWILGKKVSETSFSLADSVGDGNQPIRTTTNTSIRRVLDSDGLDDDGIADTPEGDADHDGMDDDGLDDDGFADNPTAILTTSQSYGETADAFLAGKPLSVVHADGTMEAYTYVRGDWDEVSATFTPVTIPPVLP